MSKKDDSKSEVACTCPSNCCTSSDCEEGFWFLLKIIFSQWIVMVILAATIVAGLSCLGETAWAWCTLLTSLLLLSSAPLLVGAHHHSSPHCSCSTSGTQQEASEDTNTDEKPMRNKGTKNSKRKSAKNTKKNGTKKRSAQTPKSNSVSNKKSAKSSGSKSESGAAEEEAGVESGEAEIESQSGGEEKVHYSLDEPMDANKEVKEVESAAMAVEADAEAQARGSAEVEAEMRRGGEQASGTVELVVPEGADRHQTNLDASKGTKKNKKPVTPKKKRRLSSSSDEADSGETEVHNSQDGKKKTKKGNKKPTKSKTKPRSSSK